MVSYTFVSLSLTSVLSHWSTSVSSRYIRRVLVSVDLRLVHFVVISFSSVRSSARANAPATNSAVANYKRDRDASEEDYADYWTRPDRDQLYYLPSVHSSIYAHARRIVRPNEGGRVRVLQSRSTPGYCVYMCDDTGVARVTDWTYLPDLLMWNPLDYFVTHPHINEVWCETLDTDELSNSDGGSDPSAICTASAASFHSSRSSSSNGNAASDEELPNYAIVIRRSELSYQTLIVIEAIQRDFFVRHRLGIPPAVDFTSTLHGR